MYGQQTAELVSAYRFFKEHGVCVVGHAAEAALDMARAERIAREYDWRVTWEYDPDGDLGDHEYWCRDAERGRCAGHEIEQAALLADGNFVTGLAGIIEPDRNYRRVVAAELALEACERQHINIKNPPRRWHCIEGV